MRRRRAQGGGALRARTASLANVAAQGSGGNRKEGGKRERRNDSCELRSFGQKQVGKRIPRQLRQVDGGERLEMVR
jgi:hypothetical protein